MEAELEDLRAAVKALEEPELAFLLEALTKWRDGFAETRPKIADLANLALGILDDDRQERAARAAQEREELQRLYLGLPVDEDSGSDPAGWR
jgi:hypothetical protein